MGSGVMNILSQKFWWILVILWCFVIFGFSASPTFTAKNTGVIIEHVTYAPTKQVNPLNFTARKTAHVIIYAVLALLLYNATRYNAVLSYILATIYAASDEFHQGFAPGRGPAVSDVILDSIAVLVMIGAIVQCKKRWSKI